MTRKQFRQDLFILLTLMLTWWVVQRFVPTLNENKWFDGSIWVMNGWMLNLLWQWHKGFRA